MTSRRGVCAVPRGDARCRDNWRECTLPTLNALSGPASARQPLFVAVALEGVEWVFLVRLNARPRTSASVSGLQKITAAAQREARVNEQNAPKQSKKPSEASDGPLGACNFGWLTFDAGLTPGPTSKNRCRRSVRCLARLHRITLDQGIELDARESNSKPRERPKFSSPYLKRFGLTLEMKKKRMKKKRKKRVPGGR